MKVSSCAAVLLLALAAGVQAQFDSSVYAPLSNIPPPAEGIETQYWFPDHTNLQFPAGDSVETLVGLLSTSAETFNITAIFGSLNNPAQFSTYFYNFTPQAYQRQLRAGEQITLSYSLYIPYNLPAREFQVALTAFYTTETTYSASTFFNQTIDIVEKAKWVDTELLGLWFLLFAGLAGAGYLVYSYVSSLGFLRKQKSKRAPRRPPQNAPPEAATADEWLKGTNFAQGARAPRKSTSNKDVRKAALQAAKTAD